MSTVGKSSNNLIEQVIQNLPIESQQILKIDYLEYFNSLSPWVQKQTLLTLSKEQRVSLLKNLYLIEQYAKQPVSKYCTTLPWAKQSYFLSLDCLEALFGGAAGGGKSEALLRAALQYVHVPGYAALILRRDLQRLQLVGGLIPRSHQWLAGKAKWNGQTYTWRFKSGATLQFGYLATSQDKYRYGSSEFQFIAFDELTEFEEEDYKFMFSRLRKTKDINVPLRVRAATNPGGVGHEWVKARFITPEAEQDLLEDKVKNVYFITESRAFVPSKIYDNPALQADEYISSLMHLEPVTRERLMRGDWTIVPIGLVRYEWFRRYVKRGDNIICLLKSGSNDPLLEYDERFVRRIATIDLAGGVDTETKQQHSYNACAIWDCPVDGQGRTNLVLRYIYRKKGIDYVALRTNIEAVLSEWKPYNAYVENKALGMALIADLRGKYSVQPIDPGGKDKAARAVPFLNMLEKGLVYLPKDENTWCQDYESELVRWRGLKDDTADQVDVSAYAAMLCQSNMQGIITLPVDPRQQDTRQATFMTWI